MENEIKNVAENVAEFKDYEINAKILGITPIKGDEKRLAITLDKQFDSFKKDDGAPMQTDRFGIDSYNLMKQIKNFSPIIRIVAPIAEKYFTRIPSDIFDYALSNATVKVKRVFHAANSLREDGENVYENDTYTSEIVSVVPNVDAIVMGYVMNFVIKNWSDELAAKQNAATNVIPNATNWTNV